MAEPRKSKGGKGARSPRREIRGEESTVDERPRTGTVTPIDPELARWILAQWERGEQPEFFDVIQAFAGGKILGAIVDREPFDQQSKMDAEIAARLCNRFVGSAQRDCDRVRRRPQEYYVRVHDESRDAEAVLHFPLYMRPKTVYLSALGEGHDDDELPGAESVTLRYLDRGLRALESERGRADANAGDLIYALMTERKEQQQHVRDLTAQVQSLVRDVSVSIRERAEILTNERDHEVWREERRFRLELFREGKRTVRNLLPGLFARDKHDDGAANGGAGGADGNGPARRYGPSAEQQLVDSFLHDCEEAKLSIALFGDWDREEKDGKVTLRQVKPGIFSAAQFKVFVGVQQFLLPPEALDPLMIGSGDDLAITQKQIMAAMALEGMTEGIASAPMELLALRKRRREAAPEASSSTPSPPPPSTSTSSTSSPA